MRAERMATLAAAAVSALAACGGPRRAPAPPAKEAERTYAYQVLEIRDAALNARDLDTAVEAYAPHVEVLEAGTAEIVLRGREEIRAAHGRFLAACPRARIEVIDRSYAEGGRFVTDVQRVRCNPAMAVEGFVQYEIDRGAIVRVWKRSSPLFER